MKFSYKKHSPEKKEKGECERGQIALFGSCLYIFFIDRPLSLYIIMRFERP
jgi:hypothetical protein